MRKTIISVVLLVLLFCIVALNVSAASYPTVFLYTLDDENTGAIPIGEQGKLIFNILRKYNNEKLQVELYNSSGEIIASSTSNFGSSGSTVVEQTITVDTAKLDMGIGEYTVKYWMEFYTFSEWHTAPRSYTEKIKVIENKCKGNHNLELARTVTEGNCQEEGCYLYECSKCEYYMYRHLTPHTYGACTQLDTANHTRTCTTCGNVETVPHTWNNGTITQNASCKETGIKTYTCTGTGCGATKTETIKKSNNHAYGSWSLTKAPTCTKKGQESRVCSICQKAETRDVAVSAHKMGKWTQTKAPTCTSEGTEARSCDTCAKSETRTIKKTGHLLSDWVQTKAPNCTRKGAETRSCSKCTYKETRDVKATDHAYGESIIIKKATETETGLEKKICTVCGDAKEKIIPVVSGRPGDYSEDVETNESTGTYEEVENNSNRTFWIIVVIVGVVVMLSVEITILVVATKSKKK